jgi:alpha-1,6-mannosyltransferase
MSAISSSNYPGGEGLNKLHDLLQMKPDPGVQVVVHLDTFTCMTGATRFLQDAPLHPSTDGNGRNLNLVKFDKTEDRDTLLSPAFWEDVEWVLTGDLGDVIERWEAVDSVVGWKGLKLYKPGEKVWASEPTTWWEQGLEDGWGLRDRFFTGYWVGARVEELLWILRKEGDMPWIWREGEDELEV